MHLIFGRDASSFRVSDIGHELCRSNRSYAFLHRAWQFRLLRTFLFFVLSQNNPKGEIIYENDENYGRVTYCLRCNECVCAD